MTKRATLHLMCGKMGAGKSTFAKSLAESSGAALLSEDDLLRGLYPGEVTDLGSYMTLSSRIKNALAGHICALLRQGMSVVLDFPGNTVNQRAWFRELIESSGAHHQLHYLDVSDETCRRQLRERRSINGGDPLQDDATFNALLAYFAPPTPEEQFNVVRLGAS
ncbi:ATP-binding protein [Pseudomonas sp. WAC2]|uniref:AAA family ATPase n=1 Tax=Pseudomonas sp. WAC2 TaxID=3055057 RepID=UPI0025AF3B51|nr:ATP-binding protein [Pseudomonas sp. WAC2]MDN3237990.1 ATP-binding protein [Pseudomonas sp. WAC2]